MPFPVSLNTISTMPGLSPAGGVVRVSTVNLPPVRHGLDRVQRDVDQRLLDQVGVEVQPGQPGGKLPLRRDRVLGELRRKKIEQLADQFVDVHHASLSAPAAGQRTAGSGPPCPCAPPGKAPRPAPPASGPPAARSFFSTWITPAMPARGFLISCAMPAAISPMDASRSARFICS